MGIFCEINLFKQADETYRPGQTITGLIKYAVDKPMEVGKIIISLKGKGYISLEDRQGSKEKKTYVDREIYVDIDNVVQDNNVVVPVGAYQTKFSFKIPYNIPSSTDIYKNMGSDTAECKIKYYIRIKFYRPGVFAFNKHFRKEVTIVSFAKPRLLREPLIYGETKKLMRLFSSKSSIVNIKATILNSVIPTGGKIELQYEVENSSSIIIKSVKTKLVEVHKFHAIGSNEVTDDKEIMYTDSKTSAIQCGNTLTMSIEINVPDYLHSLEYSNIVSREYVVRIEAMLPMPHRNLVLNIPIQIGTIEDVEEDSSEGNDEACPYDDPPPSYWEAMGEIKKEDI